MQCLFFHIRALRHIRASLTTEASKTMAAAIVGSRLDFCNSLLAAAGTSVSNLTRLQHVQNTLTRVVARKPRFRHITFVLSDLFWLPVRHRISKLIRLLSGFCNFSCHLIVHLSHPLMCTDTSPPLFFILICQYAFFHEKPTWQPPSCFHLLLQISGMHYQTICRPFQLFLIFGIALKHHLFLIAYPDSSAKPDKITPAQCITLCYLLSYLLT